MQSPEVPQESLEAAHEEPPAPENTPSEQKAKRGFFQRIRDEFKEKLPFGMKFLGVRRAIESQVRSRSAYLALEPLNTLYENANSNQRAVIENAIEGLHSKEGAFFGTFYRIAFEGDRFVQGKKFLAEQFRERGNDDFHSLLALLAERNTFGFDRVFWNEGKVRRDIEKNTDPEKRKKLQKDYVQWVLLDPLQKNRGIRPGVNFEGGIAYFRAGGEGKKHLEHFRDRLIDSGLTPILEIESYEDGPETLLRLKYKGLDALRSKNANEG